MRNLAYFHSVHQQALQSMQMDQTTHKRTMGEAKQLTFNQHTLTCVQTDTYIYMDVSVWPWKRVTSEKNSISSNLPIYSICCRPYPSRQ